MHLFFNLISIWAYSSVGSAKGSVFCHIYNFILLILLFRFWNC